MMYPLFEHLIVGSAVASAAALAIRKWWPTRKSSGGGCGSGCGGCGNGSACSTPAERGVQTVAMPTRTRAPR